MQQLGVGDRECIAFCSALVEKCGIRGDFEGSSNPSLSAPMYGHEEVMAFAAEATLR